MSGDRFWRQRSLLNYLLIPLSLVFASVARLRRYAYERGWRERWQAPVPVIIVGNLTVGGSGKTPVTIALVNALVRRGYRPGVITRGYGGDRLTQPLVLDSDQPVNSSSPFAGDEPQLICGETGVLVSVYPQRRLAIQALLARDDSIDVIVADDGLQHYALARTLEIVVVDAMFGFGNGLRLPAGPLREAVSRLRSVDFILSRERDTDATVGLDTHEYDVRQDIAEDLPVMLYQQSLSDCVPVINTPAGSAVPEGNNVLLLDDLVGSTVHVVSGIANPERFFQAVERLGITVIPHAFPDHHRFAETDFEFMSADQWPVVMTTKDAVKVRSLKLQQQDRLWALPLETTLPPSLIDRIVARLTPIH